MRVSRRTSIAAAVCAAVLVLAGCGGGGAGADPEPILPSSSSADPSPSEPSESEDADAAPVMPEAAKERSAEGVEAFVQYWGDVITYAQNSGDVTSMSQISSSECESCAGVIGLIEEVYAGGGSMRSAGWNPRQVVFGADPARPLAIFRRGVESTQRADEDPERFPAARVTVDFTLGRADGRWIVNEFAQRPN